MARGELNLRHLVTDDEGATPGSTEAEQAVLGAILYDNEAMFGCEALEPRHFREPVHGRMFELCRQLSAKGVLIEPIVIWNTLQDDAAMIELGGVRYLADLVDVAPPARVAKDFAAIIIETAMRRDMMAIADDMKAAAKQADLPPKETLEHAEKALYDLGHSVVGAGGFVPFGDALDKAVEMTAQAFQRDGGLGGIATGLADLDRQLGGLHPSDLIVLAGRPSMGKAQPLDAKVLMADGTWRRMGDLRFGDELASIDGAPSRVTGIFPQGVRQTYRVTLGDGRSTRACGDHLWSVRSAKFTHGEAVVSTDRLREMLTKERYQRRVSLPLVSGHFGADDGLLIDPWLLGALIGNGGMSGTSLMFSTADAATLYRVQKVVGHDCVVAAGGDYDYRIKQGADSALADALKVYGLTGKRSEGKFIPEPYLRASRQARLELLRGLMDTDGWVEAFGVVRYGTASERLAIDLQALVRSIGGSCTISSKQPHFTHNGERRAGQTAYICNIRHPDRASLLSLKRKQRRCEAPARFKSPTVVRVEPDAVEPVQCIRVSHPMSLYVTDDYIVTHNTSLATNIAYNVAKAYTWEPQPDGTRKTVSGGQVAFFSLEMSDEQLAARVLSEVAKVSSDKMRKGEITAMEFGLIRDARDEIRNVPLSIDATGGISLARLCARARRMKRKQGVDLIVIDYLQLITIDDRRSGSNRTQEVTEITQGLKALAKELNVPVIALSQLSRKVEEREDKRPQLSDLRESGSIEQDADVVAFVYREEYYLKRTEPREGTSEHLAWLDEVNKVHALAEVIIGKQRHGPIGTVRLHFNEDLTTFTNLAREDRFDFGAVRLPHGDQ